MKPALLASLLLVGAQAALAQDMPRIAVEDPRELLRAALRSADGRAHGVLRGEAAQAISRHFGASSPVYLDVSTEVRYREPGCSRLQIEAWQQGVHLPGAAEPRTGRLQIGIDYCLDGRPPRRRDTR